MFFLDGTFSWVFPGMVNSFLHRILTMLRYKKKESYVTLDFPESRIGRSLDWNITHKSIVKHRQKCYNSLWTKTLSLIVKEYLHMYMNLSNC